MDKKQINMPLVLAAIFAAGIIIGVFISNNNSKNIKSMSNRSASRIDEVLYYIENEYVDTINRKEIEDKVIVDLIDQLDPHSQYISKEEFDAVNDPLLGSFEGIGVTFRIEKDTIIIINTIKGGPSEKIGLMDGDRIVAVDDSIVAGVGITNTQVMKLLKGPKNTKVKLEVKRRGIEDLLPYTVQRGVIPTYSVDAAFMLDDNIGFVKLNKFAATTHTEFVKAVNELRSQGMTKLILDLRDNSGGYLNAAINIVDELMPKGKLIVYTEGQSRPRSVIYTRHRGIWEMQDIVILINGSSASASEIVAGALQDNDRGIIIGRRSFGKGLVQESIMLNDSSSLRLTVARYYTPTGRSIQKPFNGNREDYLYEEINRYTSGEVYSADSIHFADSLKFVTPNGKIVYGGGGIMPDIYVPIVNDSSKYYFNAIANSGILFQTAFEYADQHRNELNKKYTSLKQFKKEFRMSEATFNEITKTAAKKGIKGNKAEKEVAQREANLLFKAYIARDIFGDEIFYEVYKDNDDILKVAIETLKAK